MSWYSIFVGVLASFMLNGSISLSKYTSEMMEQEDADDYASDSGFYTSPASPPGAYLAENFDDMWMFERDWTPSLAKTSGIIPNAGGGWTVAPVQGAASPADLALVLQVGTGEVAPSAISRHLSRAARLSQQPLLVQYEVALPPTRCIQTRLKLLPADYDGPLENVSEVSSFVLMWSLEHCGQYTQMVLTVHFWSAGAVRPERRRLRRLNVAPLRDGARHQLSMLLLPNNTYQLLRDQRLAHTGSLLEDLTPLPEPADDIVKGLRPVGAVSIEVSSLVEEFYLDNLLVTSSLEGALEYRSDVALPEALPLQAPATSRMDEFMLYSSKRPWMYVVIVLVLGVPLTLLLSCCLPESLDLEKINERKKRDLYQPNTASEGTESEGTVSIAGRQGSAGSSSGTRRRLLGGGSPRRRRLLAE